MGSYVFNSITYTSSGNYTGTFTNAVGCDSVHTLNLTIIPSTTPSVVVSNPLTNALTNYTFTYVTPVAVGPGSPNPFLFWHTYFLTSPTNYPDYQVYNPLTSANLSISVNGSPVALSNFIGMQSWNSGIQIMTLTYPIPAGSLIQITTSNIITNPSIPGNYNLTWRISDGAGGNPTWFNANTSITSPCVTSYSNLNAAICQGSSYLFNGIARTTTGTYTDTLVNAGGCDSIITLNLTVKPTSTGSSTVSALGSYVFNSITYTSSGTYTGTFTNAVGCDSVHTLNLTIIPNTPPSIVVSNPLTNALTNYTFTYVTPVAVGPGSPNPFLFWHTYFLTSPANYPDYQVYNPLTSANLSISINGSPVALSNFIGMQSWNSGIQIMTLTYPIAAGSLIQITTSNIITNPSIPGNYNLTWRISDGAGTNATWFNANTSITSPCVTSYSNINAAICQGSSYLFNGIAQTTAGTYTDTLVNAGGCDSMITLNLTVNQPTFNNTAASACDVYTWPVDGNTYTTSGTYTATSTNPAGCLHTETLNLTINNSTSNSTSATACDTYTWSVDGMTYTASGTYTASSTNAAGCVHTETLNLTIIPSTSNTTNASACNSYTWSVNNQTYTSSGTYTSTVGCVTEILNLSLGANTTVTTNASACVTYTWAVNNQTYTSSGSYSYVNGCSNEILNLTINPLPLVTAPNINSCPNSSITLGGSPAGGTWNLPNPYIGTATSYTYYFTDANGCTNSANGILSSITATISNLNMTTILGISATANWVGVNGIGWFEVRYKPTSSSIWIVSTTGSTPSKILPNLTPNTAYEVQARGFCTASNVGPWSPSVFFSTTNECGVPTGLFTNNISGTTAKLNWATTNAGFYTVRWKPVASSTWVSSTTTTTNKSIASLSLNTNYEFQVKSHCGSSSSSFSASDYFTTSTSRGGNTEVEIQQPSSSIAMYPNPTTGEVTLHIASRQYATVLINVLDMSGRIVKQIQTETLEGLNQIDMNISDLSNSVYSVQILNNGQLQGVERLIKN
jgi:hypothetical protein